MRSPSRAMNGPCRCRREAIEEARQGRWEIVLTPTKPVPRDWLEVEGRHVLCLASGGGQQAPILAAAGATVTVLDNSPKQLERDAKHGRAARPSDYDGPG